MKRQMKRIIASMLAVTMVLSNSNLTALAGEIGNENEPVVEKQGTLDSAFMSASEKNAGETVKENESNAPTEEEQQENGSNIQSEEQQENGSNVQTEEQQENGSNIQSEEQQENGSNVQTEEQQENGSNIQSEEQQEWVGHPIGRTAERNNGFRRSSCTESRGTCKFIKTTCSRISE